MSTRVIVSQGIFTTDGPCDRLGRVVDIASLWTPPRSDA